MKHPVLALFMAVMLIGNANAALGKLIRQYVEARPGGESDLVCVYSIEGREVERRYPPRAWCPQYAEDESK